MYKFKQTNTQEHCTHVTVAKMPDSTLFVCSTTTEIGETLWVKYALRAA